MSVLRFSDVDTATTNGNNTMIATVINSAYVATLTAVARGPLRLTLMPLPSCHSARRTLAVTAELGEREREDDREEHPGQR